MIPKKIDLPDTLDIQKLHKLYTEPYPNFLASYDSYRNIFKTKYNIGFGYPRSGTCSTCDEFKAREQNIHKQMINNKDESTSRKLNEKLSTIRIEHD